MKPVKLSPEEAARNRTRLPPDKRFPIDYESGRLAAHTGEIRPARGGFDLRTARGQAWRAGYAAGVAEVELAILEEDYDEAAERTALSSSGDADPH